MVLNNNYEKLDNIDNNSLDVNYDSENELNNNYIDQNLFKGAHVVLVSESNPWYINKGVPKKYISDKDFVKDTGSYDRTMSPEQIYKSDVQLDTTLPDMGLGHSFLQRKLAMDNIEYFNSNKNKSDRMNRNILFIILIVLVLIWVYHRYRKNM